MEQAALRPFAATGIALLGAGVIAVTPLAATSAPLPEVQSPQVELTASADAFALIANALDPTASTDGYLAFANSLDSILDTFGNPTVNVADTLATDFVGYLELPSSLAGLEQLLSTLVGDLNAGFTLLDNTLGTLGTDLTTGLGSIETALGTTNLELSDLNSAIGGLQDALNTDLSPLTTIATELGAAGPLGLELSQIGEQLSTIIGLL